MNVSSDECINVAILFLSRLLSQSYQALILPARTFQSSVESIDMNWIYDHKALMCVGKIQIFHFSFFLHNQGGLGEG